MNKLQELIQQVEQSTQYEEIKNTISKKLFWELYHELHYTDKNEVKDQLLYVLMKQQC